METLKSSSLKLIWEIYRDMDRGFLCPTRPQIYSPKHVNLGFSLSISIPRKTIHHIYSVSSLSSQDTQTHVESEEAQIEDINESKTVCVKFQIQRECSFGEQYLIVGDDPMLGSWNPLNAVALNWSDGHLWTVELDIPIGKSLKFKFILKRGTEEILWQPGPDRILETWETTKAITVCEDWDNVELQKLVEEEPNSDKIEESIMNPDMLIDAVEDSTTSDSITSATEIPFSEKSTALVADNITDPKEKTKDMAIGENAIKNSTMSDSITSATKIPFSEKSTALVADNITDPKEKNKDMAIGENVFGNNGRAEHMKDEGNLVSYQGKPVLVPGLTPLPTARADNEASPNEVEMNIFVDTSTEFDQAKDLNVPELHLKEEHDKDEQEPHENERVENPQLAKEQEPKLIMPFDNPVLQNDIQWGRRTLLKFLANFGIL